MTPRTILSFDVEEHWRIEAAAHLSIADGRKNYDAARVGPATDWLLELLARRQVRATFFLVGELAQAQPRLVHAIRDGGHEVASHGWDHRSVLRMTPAEFREDARKSKDALEQISGAAVVGYRAPTFSVVRRTAWALPLLAELGYRYDSSVYPVRHDRYGVPEAPRGPFRTAGLVELPPTRLDLAGLKVPLGGGGYFRLFPLWLTRRAVRQTLRVQQPPVAMLYFHPWEFDPDQERLPLSRLSRWRTYVGLGRSRARLERLCQDGPFARACDVARDLSTASLPNFALAA